MQLVGIGMFPAREHFAHDQTGESAADRLRTFESLHFEPYVRQDAGGLLGIQIGFDILFKPVE